MKNLNALSFKLKLTIVAALASVSLIAVAVVSFWGYSRLAGALDTLYAERLPSYRFAATLEADVRTVHGLVNQSMVYAALGYRANEIERVDQAIERTSAEIEIALQQRLLQTPADPDEHEAVKAIHASVSKFLGAIRDTVELRPTGVGNASTFLSTAQREYETSLRLISKMSQHKLELAGQDVAASRSSANNARGLIVAAAVIAVTAALLLTLAITRQMLRSIDALLQAAHRMHAGDLGARTGLKATDGELSQVGRAFDEMAQALERREAELKAAQERLREEAITDPLTGLFNRRFLNEMLPSAVAGAARRGGTLAVVILDVDHFKRINDTFGHDAGDTVLSEVGALVKRSVRRSDTACRFGGEEFVLVLPDSTLDGAHERAEQIRCEIGALRLQHDSTPLGSITGSFGIAAFPIHADDAAGLVNAADAALYQAKQGGRNRTVVAEAGAGAPAEAEAAMSGRNPNSVWQDSVQTTVQQSPSAALFGYQTIGPAHTPEQSDRDLSRSYRQT